MIAAPEEASARASGDGKLATAQPPGLRILVLTETWERFSFYGMQALLIFYLTKHFLLTDAESYEIYGRYVALVYTAPIIGGMVADRWLGLRKAVLLGAIMLALGHFGMAFEGDAARASFDGERTGIIRDELALQIMYLSLALIAFGTGFLKPNITAALGRLYEEEDPRRDSGFTLFFLGINLGGTIAALTVGYLGQGIAWRYGFGAAGLGMLIGLVIFIRGQKHLENRSEPPNPAALRRRVVGALTLEHVIYAAIALAVLIAWQLIQLRSVLTIVVGLVSAAVVAWLLWRVARDCAKHERDRMICAMLLILASLLFFVAVLQAGTTMNLYIDRNVDRTILGHRFEASQFLALSGFFVIVLAPLFSAFWLKMARLGVAPGPVSKIGAGMIVSAFAFVSLALGGWLAPSAASVSVGWIVLAYALQSAGDLLVVPTGMSAVTKLSVPRFAGLMMGLWFLAAAGAGVISSSVAKLAALEPQASDAQTPEAALTLFTQLFIGIGIALAIAGLVVLLSSRSLRRLMHGVERYDADR